MWVGAGALSMGQVKEDGGKQFQKAGNCLEGNEVTLKTFLKKCTLSDLLIKITAAALQRKDWMGLDKRQPVKSLVCLYMFRIVRGKLTN